MINISSHSHHLFQGGSSGKGTTLRGRSDADLVIFLTNFKSFQEQLQRRGEFIKEIRRQLEACQREKTFEVKFEVQKQQWENPRALSFVLRSRQLHEWVEFDVLPAFDALGEHSQPQGVSAFVLCQGCFCSFHVSEQKSLTLRVLLNRASLQVGRRS